MDEGSKWYSHTKSAKARWVDCDVACCIPVAGARWWPCVSHKAWTARHNDDVDAFTLFSLIECVSLTSVTRGERERERERQTALSFSLRRRSTAGYQCLQGKGVDVYPVSLSLCLCLCLSHSRLPFTMPQLTTWGYKFRNRRKSLTLRHRVQDNSISYRYDDEAMKQEAAK